jgi:glycosyltransferase involved in cell wall biosynthesis
MSTPADTAHIKTSVVVPTHGRVDLLRQTLDSLARQTCESFETIVTDDSSEPAERTLVQSELDNYRRRTGRSAIYLFSEPNLGQARNTNQGLARATGRFTRILHSDDLLAPQTLAAEIALLEDNRLELRLLFHDVEAFSRQASFAGRPALTVVQPELLFRTRLHSETPLPSATIFHTDLLRAVGPMREDLDFLCDWEFFTRLLVHEYRASRFIGELSRGFVAWRVHADSTTGKLWHRHFLEHEQFIEDLRTSADTATELLGAPGRQAEFLAAAVRYRYRRLFHDIAHMRKAQLLRALPRILRCVCSPRSLRARFEASRTVDDRASEGAARAPSSGQSDTLADHLARRILRWGDSWALRHSLVSETPDHGEGVAAPELDTTFSRLEIRCQAAPPASDRSTLGILTDFNNRTNLWPLRAAFAAARNVVLHAPNTNAFYRHTLHECLKHAPVGSELELQLIDNGHLASFGAKALVDQLYPAQFAWTGQSKHGGTHHHLVYRRVAEHAAHHRAAHTGWTFGMLTTGKRLAHVERFITSIEEQCRDPYEIIIVSPIGLGELETRKGVRVLRFTDHDDRGWITRKKNLVCAAAAYSDILVCHDRFWLAPDFCERFAAWGFAYGLAAPKVRLPDGRRGLDWGVVNSANHTWSSGGLLDYRATSEFVYNPGGATLVRKDFWRKFQWNENLFWNEHEDVELCRRIQRAGEIVALADSTVIAAEDRWIDANPLLPYCEHHEVLFGPPVGEQRIRYLPT